jgi:nitroreductase
MSLWVELVEDARLAPSPHNTQPWRVHVLSETEAELHADIGRTLPDTDSDGAFMTCTFGAFVEALDVAAATHGLTVHAHCLYPNLGAGAEPHPVVARLRLVERDEGPAFPRELLERRRTHRGRFDGRPVGADALTALEALAAEAGHTASFTSDPAVVEWVVRLNADTLFDDLSQPVVRAEIARWIRRSEREARDRRDGFAPSCLGFPGWLVRLFFFRHRLFAVRPVRALARALFLRTTGGTATVGWIRGPWSSPDDHFRAGRMLMRFWLELTRCGLYLQPFGSVITNVSAHAQMVERLDADEEGQQVWLLLRIGSAAAPPRSLRLRVDEVLA